MGNDALTRNEWLETKTWLEEHSSSLPPQVSRNLSRLFKSYLELLEAKNKSLEVLRRLREAMGFIPKSEKGSQAKHL